MQMLLKGEAVNLEKAKALKLIDAVVPAGDLVKAAKDWIKGSGKAVAPWDEKGFKLPGGPVYSKGGMMMFPAAMRSSRETYDNYLRRRAIMSCVYEGCCCRSDAALLSNRATSRRSAAAREAAAMNPQPVFLSMQELNKGARRPAKTCLDKVKKFAIIPAPASWAPASLLSRRAPA